MSPEAMQFAGQKSEGSRQWPGNVNWSWNHFWIPGSGGWLQGFTTMQGFGVPVIMDCTHSPQQPNQTSGVTGGRPDLIPTIAKAAVAVGVDGLFIETHPRPSEAKSDGANMLPIEQLRPLIRTIGKNKGGHSSLIMVKEVEIKVLPAHIQDAEPFE